MARADILELAKGLLYGAGVGERPALRVAASNANESTSGSKVTFTLDTDEGQYVKPGQTLSVRADTEAAAYSMYALSVSTDTVTAVNGYRGASVTGSDSGNLDNAIIEQNPVATDWEIHQAIDTVIERMLYPEVFDFTTATHTPNLSTGVAALAATDLEVIHAYQIVGGAPYEIPAGLTTQVHTTVSANGTIGYFDYIDSSTCYTTTRVKLVIGDDDSKEIRQMVATGAAALILGASVSEVSMEPGRREGGDVGARQAAGDALMLDFLTLKAQYAEELSRETATRFAVDRG